MSSFLARPAADPLERERQEIEKRRARFEDRKKRILDTKVRTMGVDVNALDAQIAAKEAAKRGEAERTAYFDAATLEQARAIEINREIHRLQEKQRLAEIAFFQQRQALEKRERDLTACAPVVNGSSTVFLNFAGEDPQFKQRQKAQQTQQQQWITQQLLIAQEKEDRLKAEAAEFAEYQRAIGVLHAEAQAQRKAEAKQRGETLNQYNATLKQNHEQRMRQSQLAEAKANEAELSATLASDFLNERTTMYANANVHFKGFSVDEKQRILDDQARQQEANRLLKEREQAEEAEFAEEQERVRRELLRIDRERAAAEFQRKLALKNEQAVQHKEKTIREDYLNNVVYKNEVQPSYFEQFGTSHR